MCLSADETGHTAMPSHSTSPDVSTGDKLVAAADNDDDLSLGAEGLCTYLLFALVQDSKLVLCQLLRHMHSDINRLAL